MRRLNRTLILFLSSGVLCVTAGAAQVPQGGRGGAPPGPSLMQTPPKPLVANAKPVRSCESLASVALPNTTIDSVKLNAADGSCRVTATVTHPPSGDKVKGFIAQGSEFGFGKMYARGINDSALVPGEDKYIQVVSCNTHNVSLLVHSIAYKDGTDFENLVEGNDVGEWAAVSR